MSNLSGRTVIHAPVNTNDADRFLCQPNKPRVILFLTDNSVTCGSCLRVIASAEREAYAVQAELDKAIADAELVDASASGNAYQSVGTEDLARNCWDDQRAVSNYLRWGQTANAANFSYVLRMAELELARRAAAHPDLTVSSEFDAALVMDRELDLAKDEAFERPEAQAFSVASVACSATDAELEEQVTRCRRLAQRDIDRNDAAGAAGYWFAMWAARREISYRKQLLPEGHVYADR